jgi:hypothetical protein
MADRSYEIDGRIHKVFPIKDINDKFWLREFILAIDEDTKYPQYIKMQLAKDKADLLTEEDAGKDAIVFFNLRGWLFDDRKTGEKNSFTNIDAWRLKLMEPGDTPHTYEGTQEQAAAAYAVDENGDALEDPENIPF